MKKPSYSVIQRELERVFNQARTHSDYTDAMRQEIIQRSLQKIRDSEMEMC